MAIRIDCDSHFNFRDMFDDVDPRFGDRRPQLWFDAAGRAKSTYPEREVMLSHHQRVVLPNSFQWSRAREELWDPDSWIVRLDRHGIDMQVLVPSAGAAIFGYSVEPDLASSVCQSYNNCIGRLLRRYPGRYIGLAHLPMQSPTRALQELDRAVNELGIQAVMMFSNVEGRNLDEPEFWPVYQRIEELGVALVIHPSRSGPLLGLERLEKYHLDNALGFLYEGSLAITSFIVGGVLDLFPKLRVGLMETGCGYLPYLMDRLQEVYDVEGVDKLIKRRPAEYLDQIWVAANVSTEKKTLLYVVECFGANRLMMSMDFPHGLGGAGESTITDVETNSGLTAEQKDRILGLNAAELFGIPADTAPLAPRQGALATA